MYCEWRLIDMGIGFETVPAATTVVATQAGVTRKAEWSLYSEWNLSTMGGLAALFHVRIVVLLSRYSWR